MCCICMDTMFCIYCFFPPLLLSGSPDDRCRCSCDRLRRRRPYPPYYRASRQAEPLPLSHISPTFLYLSVALGICCYATFLFKCIACHCRHLLYLSYILCSLL